jgi:hypothetical protein
MQGSSKGGAALFPEISDHVMDWEPRSSPEFHSGHIGEEFGQNRIGEYFGTSSP